MTSGDHLSPDLNSEQALRDSEARHRAIFETAVDGILTIDERGAIESVNPAAVRLFGYGVDELIGQNVKLLMPEPYFSEHDGYLEHYRSTSERKVIGIGREVQGKRKDGSVFPLDLAVSEVKLGARRVFTGIVRDVTERKRAQQELVQAKDDAVAASAAKDHFIAIVSHELRTPLNPILATVSYLQNRADLPPDVREDVLAIRRNVEHEARLVDDLLNLTRLSRGKIELHQEAVDAHAMARSVLAQFPSQLDEKNIQLTTLLGAKHHYVWADPTRLRQVLINLVDNAIKFSQNKGAISLRTSDSVNGRFRLEVSDGGIGIEPDVLKRLFNPFEQGEQTITRKFGGLGLGLAISKQIIDLHGAKLIAESDGAGKGSTFALELDIVPRLAAGRASLENPPSQAVSNACRVLLVEDHRDTLRVMSKLLKAMGYGVISAMSVGEALRVSHEQPFDILLSDIGLPDGTGLDLLRQMKVKHPVKAIAISGFCQDEDRMRSKNAGFLEHLTKPIDFQKLESTLRRVTEQDIEIPPGIGN